MTWKGRKVLVTGAGGFIGSHLIEQLVAEGADVRAFVRYNSRGDIGLLRLLPAEIRSRLVVISGSLADAEAVREAVRDMDTIFHLAALIAIPYSYLHPREVIETNVMGTLNVLSAAREYGVRRVVHTSTSEVYGSAQYVPIDEAHPLQGQSPYSASKIAADKVAESFWCSYDLPVATLRPFNTYGPRQSARAIIPTIITQVLAGDKIRLGALEPVRDFTFVKDTIKAFLLGGELDAAIGQQINVGTGLCISIGDLARQIMRLLGRELPIVPDEERLRPPRSEVSRLLANRDRAQKLLGWEPLVSLDEGLALTISWIHDHLSLYRPGVYEV